MNRIRNQNDLFGILEENPPHGMGQILEALSTGKTELLGGFKQIPPSPLPGWIIIVTSRHETVWNVVVTAHENPPRFTTWIVQRIPWEHWTGKINRDPTVYDGDHSMEYFKRKLEARVMNGHGE